MWFLNKKSKVQGCGYKYFRGEGNNDTHGSSIKKHPITHRAYNSVTGANNKRKNLKTTLLRKLIIQSAA